MEREGMPLALQYAHDVLCADDLDWAQRAFAALCEEDLEAAKHLAQLLDRLVPTGAALWAAIIARADLPPATKPWRWARNDPVDTANAVEAMVSFDGSKDGLQIGLPTAAGLGQKWVKLQSHSTKLWVRATGAGGAACKVLVSFGTNV